jgi:hypothetical protein
MTDAEESLVEALVDVSESLLLAVEHGLKVPPTASALVDARVAIYAAKFMLVRPMRLYPKEPAHNTPEPRPAPLLLTTGRSK